MLEIPQQDVYIDDPRREFAPYVPKGASSVLDVGCGKGGFGLTLREILGANARITGIEAEASQAQIAAEEHGFNEVFCGYFPQDLPASSTYDLVTFLDVLEHVYDPWDVLRSTRTHLSDGGYVLAGIPSIQYAPVLRDLIRGRWNYTDTGTLDRTHVRFFTKESMVTMFEDADLDVLAIEGVNSVWHHHWPQRTLRRRAMIKAIPDSEWLHYVVLAQKRGSGADPDL